MRTVVPRPDSGTSRRVGQAAGERAGRAIQRLILATGMGLLLVNLVGLPYYLAPLSARLRHPYHAWLKPSGHVGQALGMISLAFFLVLWLYPLRKRLGSRLSFTGALGGWLDWHVAVGLLVPWLAATHAAWRFTGLIGMGYGAMIVVYFSGLLGRYIYVRIPRRRSGVDLTLDEVTAERERLLFELTATTGLSPSQVRQLLAPDLKSGQETGFLRTAIRMVRDDIARRRAARSLKRRLSLRTTGSPLNPADLKRALQLARREMALAQQVRMLDATHRALRYWHVAHKPVAVTALVAVLAHVAVAVVFGGTWLD